MNFIISKKSRSTGMPSAYGSEFKGDGARKKYTEGIERIFGDRHENRELKYRRTIKPWADESKRAADEKFKSNFDKIDWKQNA